jgi:tRNA(Ile)-lysidine synthase
VLSKLLEYIREHRLVRAGDRLGVAVSGGADSVALLRALLELQSELGLVLSVVHLHHGIRGAHADADLEFVRQLAESRGLEFHHSFADVPASAAEEHLGLEAAGRKLRYLFFAELVKDGKLDRVATAHNFDDQAETVLLRFFRGAWTRGLSGIYPAAHAGHIIRPLLNTTRSEIIQYLHSLDQPWREDATNADRDFLRNRVRHDLLPLLERDFNPAVRSALANIAEIARAEQNFWSAQTKAVLENLRVGADQTTALKADSLLALPLALRRRVLLAEAHARLNVDLEFREIESLLRLAAQDAPGRLQLRGAWAELVKRDGRRLLLFTFPATEPASEPQGYEYRLAVPGEISIPELKVALRATFVDVDSASEGYNPTSLLDPSTLASELVVRNWRPGDRFLPLRSRSEEKLKRLLQEKKIVHPQKALWPVITSDERIVWVRGFPVASRFAFRAPVGRALMIEECPERGLSD